MRILAGLFVVVPVAFLSLLVVAGCCMWAGNVVGLNPPWLWWQLFWISGAGCIGALAAGLVLIGLVP